MDQKVRNIKLIQQFIKIIDFLKFSVQEEVFVESHDDQDEINPENYEYQSRKRFGDNLWMEKLKRRFKQTKEGVIGCPNK